MNPTERELLGPLDPARREAPPARGSARHQAILERAMSQTDLRPTVSPEPTRSPSRRWRLAGAPLAAAAAVAAIAVGVVGGNDSPTTTALTSTQVVLTAATNTARADSFRASLKIVGDEDTRTATAEFAGEDSVISETGADGARTVTTSTGGRLYTTEAGVTTSQPKTEADQLDPFASSAAAVLDAALTGADAQEVGTEPVRGTSARHYRVGLTSDTRAALAALTPGQLAWFDLESTDQATGVDVWVAGDLIRRIDVAGSRGPGTSVSTEFYDFGAAITITAPKSS